MTLAAALSCTQRYKYFLSLGNIRIFSYGKELDAVPLAVLLSLVLVLSMPRELAVSCHIHPALLLVPVSTPPSAMVVVSMCGCLLWLAADLGPDGRWAFWIFADYAGYVLCPRRLQVGLSTPSPSITCT